MYYDCYKGMDLVMLWWNHEVLQIGLNSYKKTLHIRVILCSHSVTTFVYNSSDNPLALYYGSMTKLNLFLPVNVFNLHQVVCCDAVRSSL